jgi:hypothetical protein
MFHQSRETKVLISPLDPIQIDSNLQSPLKSTLVLYFNLRLQVRYNTYTYIFLTHAEAFTTSLRRISKIRLDIQLKLFNALFNCIEVAYKPRLDSILFSVYICCVVEPNTIQYYILPPSVLASVCNRQSTLCDSHFWPCYKRKSLGADFGNNRLIFGSEILGAALPVNKRSGR